MTAKTEQLKPHLLAAVERLRKFIELDAPGVIIGAEAWNIFATTLATFGPSAGTTMVDQIRSRNLHARGICDHGDCVTYVDHPDIGMCEAHLKELGLEDAVESVE